MAGSTAPAVHPGIELTARDVERARRALGSDADVRAGDIRHLDFGAVDAVVALDVLHYLAASAQSEVLKRVRAALPAGGLLLLRVCDADGRGARCTRWTDRMVALLRGHVGFTPHYRGLSAWQALLRESGFDNEPVPMSRGNPFANVLLVARAI